MNNMKLKDYEKKIMEKSDDLKKAYEEQMANLRKHQEKLDLILNDCERIVTHKKKFSD